MLSSNVIIIFFALVIFTLLIYSLVVNCDTVKEAKEIEKDQIEEVYEQGFPFKNDNNPSSFV